MTKHAFRTLLISLAASGLSACGGGVDEPTVSISGKVLDGNVAGARVCLDIDKDRQCTQVDRYVTTAQDGSYILSTTASALQNALLIADIRYMDSSDNDYTNARADYDYVLNGFDVAPGQENNISPLSSYMQLKMEKSQLSAAQVRTAVANQIILQDQSNYRTPTGAPDYSQYVTSDFTQSPADEYPAITDFKKRLHSLNQVMARELQESQAFWEDAYYNGSYTPTSSSWNTNSASIIENARMNVFENYDVILQQVSRMDFNNFDAELLASTLSPTAPTPAQLVDIQKYTDLLKQVENNNLAGSTYTYDSYFNGRVEARNYIHFSSTSLTIYVVLVSDGSCVESSIPGAFAGLSEQQFVSAYNQVLQADSSTSNALVKTGSLPANCSNISSLIANAGISTNITNSAPNTAPTQVQMYQPGYPSIGVKAIVVSPYKSVGGTTPLTPGSLAPATLSSCNYGTVQYAINPCSTPNTKN